MSHSSNINVRTVWPGPTRHDTYSIHSANEDECRAVITSVVYTSVILRAHTASNSNKTATQTYVLFVQDKNDTRFIHSTNEDQRRAVIIVIVVYLDSTWGWDYDCILHPKATTPSNSSTHAAMQTHALFVQGQHDTRSIHSTNKGQHRQSRHRHCSVFGEHVKMTLYYIDHQ